MEPVFDPSKLKKKKKIQQAKSEIEETKEKVQLSSEEKTSLDSLFPERTETKRNKEIYSYDQMLKMLYDQMPVKEETNKIPLPIVENTGFGGGLMTRVHNYRNICKALNRDERHFLIYLGTELNVDKKGISDNGSLWLKGKFLQKEIKTVISNYSNEFVVCKTCGGRNTSLVKENGIQFVKCKCGGKKSVLTLKEK